MLKRVNTIKLAGVYEYEGWNGKTYIIEIYREREHWGESWTAYITYPRCAYKYFLYGEPVQQNNRPKPTTLAQFKKMVLVDIEEDIDCFELMLTVCEEGMNDPEVIDAMKDIHEWYYKKDIDA